MLVAILSFFAGILTVFAPCVLPLLPIILGGSLDARDQDKRRPYIITASLVLSLVAFTILLKASTALIGIDPHVWLYVSGGIVIALGVFMLFPQAWTKVIGFLGFEHRSQELLGKAGKTKSRTWSAVLTGAALGPVFSSCSPTYAWVIATVLPANPTLGVVYLAIYCLGLAIALLAIALLGRRLLVKVKWASDPKGWFQRSLAVLFIVVGLFIITGWDKQVQTWLVDKDFLNLISLEEKLVPTDKKIETRPDAKTQFNVSPYKAPEFKDVDSWINSSPLTVAGLKGKVVLIDFWTYSCINCQRTQPYLNEWYKKYKNEGFEIVGMHAPEFSFERVKANVENAVNDAKITYPVALDNNFATWRAYDNHYWPAKYLVDNDGFVRYTHFGEGDYDETEEAVQTLLAERGATNLPSVGPGGKVPASSLQTPETYLGYTRADRFVNTGEFKADQTVAYTLNQKPPSNYWSLGGKWKIGKESSEAMQDEATLTFTVSAKDVYLVMNGKNGTKVTVSMPGASFYGSDVDESGNVTLKGPTLYSVVDFKTVKSSSVVRLTFPKGTTINAFTFGS